MEADRVMTLHGDYLLVSSASGVHPMLLEKGALWSNDLGEYIESLGKRNPAFKINEFLFGETGIRVSAKPLHELTLPETVKMYSASLYQDGDPTFADDMRSAYFEALWSAMLTTVGSRALDYGYPITSAKDLGDRVVLHDKGHDDKRRWGPSVEDVFEVKARTNVDGLPFPIERLTLTYSEGIGQW